MTTLRVLCAVAITGAIGVQAVAGAPDTQLAVPADLARYKQWPRLLESPANVPMKFWLMCMPPSAADRAAAKEQYGPHSERTIMVYGNQLAAGALVSTGTRAFPPGAIVVKEKLGRVEGGAAEGVAFMIKHQAPAFAASDGWEFRYFPSDDPAGTQQACAPCHRRAPSKDYVFGRYPK